jgi:tetratricopeptide (TPR) repeat protein
MKIVSAKSASVDLISEAKKTNLTFLVGAGISKIQPSNLPLGNDIKDYLISLITRDPILRPHQTKILSSDKYRKLIPELIFQPLFEILESKMYTAFDILNTDEFNYVHEVLSWMNYNKSAQLFTTNFDMLIEKSISHSIYVEHLHGALSQPDEMVIRIYQVGRGISRSLGNKFKSSNRGRTLFVLGYSGNDKDVVTLLNQTDFREIYWLVRDAKDDWTRSNIKKVSNYNVKVFQTDLTFFLKDTSRYFSIPVTTFGKKITAPSVKPKDIGVTYTEALRCIQSIYYTIGNYNDALNICNKILKDKKIKLSAKDGAWFHQVAADNVVCIGTNYKSAIAHINTSIEISKISGDRLDLAEAYNAIGNIYGQRNKSHALEALEFLRLAKKEANSLLHKKLSLIQRDQLYVLLGKIHNNTGLGYDSLGKYHKAIEHYKQSIKYKRKAGNITAIAVSQANISLCYRSLNDRHYSYWARKAEEIFSQYGLFYRLGYLYRELGGRSHAKDASKALKYLEMALKVYKDNVPDAKFDITLTNRYLAKLRPRFPAS